MQKEYYDHRSRLCDECHHHAQAGLRETIGTREEFPEGCLLYGYSFHDYPEDAEDCEGFQTEEQWQAEQKQKELLKKKRKK